MRFAELGMLRHHAIRMSTCSSADVSASCVASNMPLVRDADLRGIGIAINPMTPPLRDALLRLLSLLDTPADIPVLAPMAERELLYRLLQGPQGRLLRQIAQPEVRWVVSGGRSPGFGTTPRPTCVSRRSARRPA